MMMTAWDTYAHISLIPSLRSELVRIGKAANKETPETQWPKEWEDFFLLLQLKAGIKVSRVAFLYATTH